MYSPICPIRAAIWLSIIFVVLPSPIVKKIKAVAPKTPSMKPVQAWTGKQLTPVAAAII